MLKAEIGLDVVKSWMKALTAVTDDGVLNITPEGVHTIAVDMANVSIVKCEMPMSEFEEYECSGDGEDRIGVDLARLLSILNTLNGDDPVNLVLDDKKIALRYGNLNYSLTTLAEDFIRREPKMPELEHEACVSLPATQMRGILAAAAKIADMCTMQIESDGNGGHTLCFSADGEMDNLRYDLTEMDQVLFEYVNKNVKSMFSLDYLTTLFKAATGQVKLYLGDYYPLRTTFNGHAQVEYLLAPRIDSDSDYAAAQTAQTPESASEEAKETAESREPDEVEVENNVEVKNEVEQASEIVNKTKIGGEAKVEDVVENVVEENTEKPKSAIDIALEQMRGGSGSETEAAEEVGEAAA